MTVSITIPKEKIEECPGSKLYLCDRCFCMVCNQQGPPLMVFQWKNGNVIILCDDHVSLIDLEKINKEEFDEVTFLVHNETGR